MFSNIESKTQENNGITKKTVRKTQKSTIRSDAGSGSVEGEKPQEIPSIEPPPPGGMSNALCNKLRSSALRNGLDTRFDARTGFAGGSAKESNASKSKNINLQLII